MFTSISSLIAAGLIGAWGTRRFIKPQRFRRKVLVTILAASLCMAVPPLGFVLVGVGGTVVARRFSKKFLNRNNEDGHQKGEKESAKEKIQSLGEKRNNLENTLSKQKKQMDKYMKSLSVLQDRLSLGEGNGKSQAKKIVELENKIKSLRNDMQENFLLRGRMDRALQGTKVEQLSAVHMVVDPEKGMRFILPHDASEEMITEMKATICSKFKLPLNTDCITVGEHHQTDFNKGIDYNENGTVYNVLIFDSKNNTLSELGVDLSDDMLQMVKDVTDELEQGVEKELNELSEMIAVTEELEEQIELQKDGIYDDVIINKTPDEQQKPESEEEVEPEVAETEGQEQQEGQKPESEPEPKEEEKKGMTAEDFLRQSQEDDEPVIAEAVEGEGQAAEPEVEVDATGNILSNEEKKPEDEKKGQARSETNGVDAGKTAPSENQGKGQNVPESGKRKGLLDKKFEMGDLKKDVLQLKVIGPNAVGVVMNGHLLAYAVAGKDGSVRLSGVDTSKLSTKELVHASRLDMQLKSCTSMKDWLNRAGSAVKSDANMMKYHSNVNKSKQALSSFSRKRQNVSKLLSVVPGGQVAKLGKKGLDLAQKGLDSSKQLTAKVSRGR